MRERDKSWIVGLAPRGRGVLGNARQVDRPPQPDLVDRRRASRLFDLAGLEHRRHQAAAGRLSVHDRPALPARRIAGTDRLADAVSLHLRGDDVRRAQLDDLQRHGAVHPDDRAGVFRHPAGHAVLADAAGRRDGRARRRQFRLQHGQYFVLLSGPDERLGARAERGRRQYRRQQRAAADADPDGHRAFSRFTWPSPGRAGFICRMPG